MRFRPFAVSFSLFNKKKPSLSPLSSFMATQTPTVHTQSSMDAVDDDDRLCLANTDLSVQKDERRDEEGDGNCGLGCPRGYLSGESRIERAWSHWRKLGQPKLMAAPMVDNSELPFRMLCRKYGAEAAYTPMLHSRIFTENEKYRSQEFTTCKVSPAY